MEKSIFRSRYIVISLIEHKMSSLDNFETTFLNALSGKKPHNGESAMNKREITISGMDKINRKLEHE